MEAAETKLSEANTEFDSKLESEKSAFAEQLKSHAESIQILVMEKTDLEGLLTKTQVALSSKDGKNKKTVFFLAKGKSNFFLNFADEIAKLQEELKVFGEEKVERDVMKENLGSVDKTVIETLRRDCEKFERTVTDLNQEISELSSKFSAKEQQVQVLNGELAEAKSKLELAQVNLDQLRSAGSDSKPDQINDQSEEVERLVRENQEHVKRVEELTAYIQKATQDREQIIHQYTSYSQQLTTQIQTLTSDLDDKKIANHTLACREADLVSHVQRLEDQLQQLMRSKSDVPDTADVDNLRESLTNHVQRVRDLESTLSDVQKANDQLNEEKSKQVRAIETQNTCCFVESANFDVAVCCCRRNTRSTN